MATKPIESKVDPIVVDENPVTEFSSVITGTKPNTPSSPRPSEEKTSLADVLKSRH